MPAEQPDASRRPSLAALVLLSGVGPFCTDTYLAALPELQESLGTTAAAAQLTITTCIVGLAIGMLFGGSLSDGIGRRWLLLISCATFFLASITCVFAPDITTLIICRLVQGTASGIAASVARAVVSDSYAGLDAAKMYGTLAAIGLLAPVIAPAAGGVIVSLWDWRAVFILMAVLGAAMTVTVAVGVPESAAIERSHSSQARALWTRARDLLALGEFRSAVAIQCFMTAGFFVYIGGSSYVFQEGLGAGPGLYSAVFAVNAAAMAVASLVFRASITRVTAHRLRAVGISISVVAAVLLLVVTLVFDGHPPIVAAWACLMPMVGGMGLTQPASTVIGQEEGRAHPGTAASLQGGLAFLIGAAATPLTGIFAPDSLLLMSWLMIAFFAVALVFFFGSRGNIS